MLKPIRVCFIFRAKADGNVGGAERSMLRLMQSAHPRELECQVVFYKRQNTPYQELLEDAGIPTRKVDGIIDLYTYLCKNKPDVVYLFARPHLVLWGTASKLAKIPMIIAAERGAGDTFIDWISQRLSRHFVDVYITNSETSRAHLISAKIPSRNTFIIYNGIDEPPHSSSFPSEALDLGSPSIVCVANICPKKGQEILLEAISLLRNRFPRIPRF